MLHGGVPRNPNVSVQLLRGISTRRQLPQDPRTAEDRMFFDCLWAVRDLNPVSFGVLLTMLEWLQDPHEGNGLATSSRGDGCVKFGRSSTLLLITLRFI